MNSYLRNSLRCAVLVNLLVLPLGALMVQPVQADLFVFKDGYILQGKVKTESVTDFDAEAREMITRRKGFMYVEDSVRRTVFAELQVRHIQPKDRPDEIRFVNKQPIRILNPKSPPPLEEWIASSPFNKNWERVIKYRSGRGILAQNQRAGFLTPYLVRIDATTTYNWNQFYLTQELGLDVVRGLVSTHPEMKDSKDLKPEERVKQRFRYSDFFAQAGWYDESQAELERMQKNFPDQKERIEAALTGLNRLRTQDGFETIKRMHLAGQYAGVRKRLENFPEKDAENKVLADLTEMRADYNAVQKKITEVERHLELLPTLVAPAQQALFKGMAREIKNELTPDNIARLDTFLGQAAQAERQRQAGQTPTDAVDVLALAVTGWLLGSPSAEAKPARAVQLWTAREMILRYLATTSEAGRSRLLADYQNTKDAVALDEMMQIIPTLPPPAPEVKLDTKPTEVRIELGRSGSAGTYLLKLPPEYRHGRPYPVLMVLHMEDEKAIAMLDRWSSAAAEQGYILAAPSWNNGLGGAYGYSEREHATVLATLKDLRRRFNIDSDRVFLFGLGQGANMAFDVGLSHPDLFAGVMPMSGGPDLFVWSYWRNAQNLPFYVITGDTSGENERKLRDFVTNCTLAGFPILWSRYRGRGAEWFSGEIPNLFDWMRGKRRIFPLQQLGTDGLGGAMGREFRTMRNNDSQFYWLTTTDLHPNCLNYGENWKKSVNPATLTGRIDSATNEVYIKMFGVRRGAILIGRNYLGQNMLDYTKPVTIRVNKDVILGNQKIIPSLKVLLESLYQTGDRQRLFLARIDFKVG